MTRGLVSLIGVALSIPVLLGVLTESYGLEDAAVRLVVLAVAVTIIDRLIAPAMSVLMVAMRHRSEAADQG
jgi:hypothetical protein